VPVLEVKPFRAYRYSAKAGSLEKLVTQPYDKITPEMQREYLARSPFNIVRIILGQSFPGDSPTDNVYTRAAGYFRHWLEQGILIQDPQPAFYPYYQEFTLPDTGERLLRKGFIGLGPVVDYSAGLVYRHEHTLHGPKQDRLELLRHTRAHFGQIFMLYEDPQGTVEELLDEATAQAPLGSVIDDYGALHRLWKIEDPDRCRLIQELMAGKRLLIADGHHRYETALAFLRENPNLPGARHVMMTFVNLHSKGVRILATHRLLKRWPGTRAWQFLEALRRQFPVTEVGSPEVLVSRLAAYDPETIRVAVVVREVQATWLIEVPRPAGELDVQFLHREILAGLLELREERIAAEEPILYVRGIDNALELVRSGQAEAAFFIPPVPVTEVARIAFSGGVMPQKSTDFFPKLLSGLTIYKADDPQATAG